MEFFKNAVHLTFPSLADKRLFCLIINKFRKHKLVNIIDLGKDEDGVHVEVAFRDKSQMVRFEKFISENHHKMRFYKT